MMKSIIMCVVCAMAFAAKAELVHYVELEFTQSSFALSISHHAMDALNAFSVTIPTTKKFYDSISVGQELGSRFKTATFMLSRQYRSYKVKVKRKFIREE